MQSKFERIPKCKRRIGPTSRRLGLVATMLIALVPLWVLAQRYYSDNRDSYGSLSSSGTRVAPRYDSGPGYYTPYGTFYGGRTELLSENDLRSMELRDQRRQRAQDRNAASEQRREETQRRRDEEAAQRQDDDAGRQASPDAGAVTLSGYESPPADSVVDAAIAENQRRARASYAPRGPKPIPGMTMIGVGDSMYYYKNGVFYAPAGDEKPVEVEAPIGAMVFDVPASATTQKVGTKTYYKVADAYFTRTLMMGQVVYEVVEPPV